MAKKNSGQGLGWWAFIAGLVIAVITGFTASPDKWALLLVILGLVVGYLNISDREASSFLVAAIALMIAGSTRLEILWAPLGPILSSLVTLVAPAAIVVAVKTVYETAK